MKSILKEYTHKDYRLFQKKGVEETNILHKFYENRWIGFVDIGMAMCIFLSAANLFTLSRDQNRNILKYMIWFSFGT